MKLRMVATPRSPSVHGRYETIRLLTCAFSDHEKPRFPCTRFPRYCTYCTQRLVCTLKANWSSMALTQMELQMPDDCARAMAPATGLPGTTRGSRKLTVIATHAARR